MSGSSGLINVVNIRNCGSVLLNRTHVPRTVEATQDVLKHSALNGYENIGSINMRCLTTKLENTPLYCARSRGYNRMNIYLFIY